MKNHEDLGEKVELTEFIGCSKSILNLRKLITSVAKGDDHVTIYGEVGTEKILTAITIFEKQKQYKKLFYAQSNQMNVSIDEFVSQTFFPDGNYSKKTLAGILLIEAVEELSTDIQQYLLSILQSKKISNPKIQKDIPINLRVISTAMPKLIQYLQEGNFDSNLFFELTSVSIKIPSLRERKQDIPLLLEYFLKKFCHDMVKEIPPCEFEILDAILKYDWPGNVLEFQNIVRSMIVTSPQGELDLSALPLPIKKDHFSEIGLQDLKVATASLEKELIQKALRRFAGNQSKAAKVLCISEPNLRYKMKKLKINSDF